MNQRRFMLLVLLIPSAVFLYAYINTGNTVQWQKDLCPQLLDEIKVKQLEAGSGSKLDWWQAAALIHWYIVSPREYVCKDIFQAGNWHVCQDTPYTVQPPCLVYSFGIANDFSFDDSMGWLGCEVHSFDPSMNVGDHRRSDNVTFHAVGLSGEDNAHFEARHDSYVRRKQIWQIYTLKTIMRKLGHENRIIDVLKIDVEGHEWAVIQNLMDDNLLPQIRQFYLEFHLFPDWPAKSSYNTLYNVYTRLKQSGFVEFRKSPHPHNFNSKTFNMQGDINFVNVNFTGMHHARRHIKRRY